jgi:RNA-dependent RNA polymerase
MWNPSDDSDISSDLESDDDNSQSFVAETTSAIDDLVWVRTWSRRTEIENGKSFGKFLALRVRLRYTTDLYDALEALKGFGKRSYYAPINIEDREDETDLIDRFAPEIQYSHECLIGLHPNLRCRMASTFYDLLWRMAHRRDQDNCINALYQISASASQDYFTNPEHELDTLLARDQDVRRARISRTSVPAHCALVRRLVLTPTRVIPFPAEVMELNRVLRNYQPNYFISVSIREEDYSKLRGQRGSLEVILEGIKGYMLQGLRVGDRVYEYVGCSNSQMRSHGCWFVQPYFEGDANDIREWMGDLSGIR